MGTNSRKWMREEKHGGPSDRTVEIAKKLWGAGKIVPCIAGLMAPGAVRQGLVLNYGQAQEVYDNLLSQGFVGVSGERELEMLEKIEGTRDAWQIIEDAENRMTQ